MANGTTVAAPRSPRVREKHGRRRKEILRAARRGIREQGYHPTTLEDIAERLGVGKTALYHYFPDKESILYACHEESLEAIAARDRYERALQRIIAQGIEDGEIRTVNPGTTVFAVLGSINWIARWYRPEGSLHADELGPEFAHHLVGGLTCG